MNLVASTEKLVEVYTFSTEQWSRIGEALEIENMSLAGWKTALILNLIDQSSTFQKAVQILKYRFNTMFMALITSEKS